ncbi:MAG: hypothetical protein AABO41_23845 [Acidobacteriota bacterium]
MKLLPVVFEEREIRRVFDEKTETWFFSVVDIIQVLTQQPDYQASRKYWKVLKGRLAKEGSELVTNCYQLKMAADDGKMRLTDVASAETWFFSVADIIQVLTQSPGYQTARKYWNKLRERLNKGGSQAVTDCHQFKFGQLPSAQEGHVYRTQDQWRPPSVRRAMFFGGIYSSLIDMALLTEGGIGSACVYKHDPPGGGRAPLKSVTSCNRLKLPEADVRGLM